MEVGVDVALPRASVVELAVRLQRLHVRPPVPVNRSPIGILRPRSRRLAGVSFMRAMNAARAVLASGSVSWVPPAAGTPVRRCGRATGSAAGRSCRRSCRYPARPGHVGRRGETPRSPPAPPCWVRGSSRGTSGRLLLPEPGQTEARDFRDVDSCCRPSAAGLAEPDLLHALTYASSESGRCGRQLVAIADREVDEPRCRGACRSSAWSSRAPVRPPCVSCRSSSPREGAWTISGQIRVSR